jgi:hypothetical protein
MRLLHAVTKELHEFYGAATPPYAILSHTWREEEVLFQDIVNGFPKEPKNNKKQDFKKILDCCRQATKDGLEWVWIDTCTIDKSSSSELSEAINSMFRWYREAKVCYAYLDGFSMKLETKTG